MSKLSLPKARSGAVPERLAVEEQEDLRDVLTGFWLEALKDAPDYGDKIKASEMLAKYILESGPTPIKRRGPRRPPTADVLRLAAKLEQEHV